MTSLRWHSARQLSRALPFAGGLYPFQGKRPARYLYSLLFYLYSISCTLNSSCQLELYRHAEVLCGCGVGRRGEERFVELAVIVGRESDEL
mgnify:CR=1 FL=1